MWAVLMKIRSKNDNKQTEISFLDVKALYDAAYAEKDKAKVNLRAFKNLLEQAENLDAQYRIQLQTKAICYTTPVITRHG